MSIFDRIRVLSQVRSDGVFNLNQIERCKIIYPSLNTKYINSCPV